MLLSLYLCAVEIKIGDLEFEKKVDQLEKKSKNDFS